MDDALIIAGTALVGGIAMRLHKRLPTGQRLLAGLLFLTLGWAAALAMAPSGPLPSPAGSACGIGLLLAGVLLVMPSLQQAERERRGRAKG